MNETGMFMYESINCFAYNKMGIKIISYHLFMMYNEMSDGSLRGEWFKSTHATYFNTL